MVVRLRIIDTGNFAPGSVTNHTTGNSASGNAFVKRFEQKMTDVAKTSTREKPMDIQTTKLLLCEPINGVAVNPLTQLPVATFNALVPSGAGSIHTGSQLSPTHSSSFHVPKVLSLANPSRPYVDAGVFIGELRDFPGMGKAIWHNANRIYKGLGKRNMTHRERLDTAFRNSLRELTNADEHFVSNQFGWLPFLNDVIKFTDVGEAVEKRLKELKNLQQRGSKSRTITLETMQSNSLSNITLNSSAFSLRANVSVANSLKVWGSASFQLESDSPLVGASDAQVLALARKAVMGLHVDGSTAWNLMPWSWLMDWASNTGDLIASTRNVVGAKARGGVCIMTRLSRAKQMRMVRPPGGEKLSGGNFLSLVLSRKREVFPSGFVLPEMGMQILSARQSAILGSLATMRAKRL